jgi:hypothetical protein
VAVLSAACSALRGHACVSQNLCSVVELKDVEEIKLRLLEAEAEGQDSDENQLKKVCALDDSAVYARAEADVLVWCHLPAHLFDMVHCTCSLT